MRQFSRRFAAWWRFLSWTFPPLTIAALHVAWLLSALRAQGADHESIPGEGALPLWGSRTTVPSGLHEWPSQVLFLPIFSAGTRMPSAAVPATLDRNLRSW